MVELYKLAHGTTVLCDIEEASLIEAIVSVETYPHTKRVYLCQNYKNGGQAIQKFGMLYSWYIGYQTENQEEFPLHNVKIHEILSKPIMLKQKELVW